MGFPGTKKNEHEVFAPRARRRRKPEEEEEEEEFITSGNWRGKHNSLSRGAGAENPVVKSASEASPPPKFIGSLHVLRFHA